MSDLEQSPKKKEWYKRWWMWPVYALVGISFISALDDVSNAPETSSTSDTSSVTQTEQSAPEPEAIKVTPDILLSEYNANGVAADAKYKDNLLEITGVVRSIDKDIMNTPYIAFESGSNMFESVQCMFKKGDEPTLATVEKGQNITLRGQMSGKLGNVIVRDCVIVP